MRRLVSNFARYANGVAGSEAFMDSELLEAPEIVMPAGGPNSSSGRRAQTR